MDIFLKHVIRDIAQWLKTHIVLAEDLDLIPSTHMVTQKASSGIRQAHYTHAYMQAKHTSDKSFF